MEAGQTVEVLAEGGWALAHVGTPERRGRPDSAGENARGGRGATGGNEEPVFQVSENRSEKDVMRGAQSSPVKEMQWKQVPDKNSERERSARRNDPFATAWKVKERRADGAAAAASGPEKRPAGGNAVDAREFSLPRTLLAMDACLEREKEQQKCKKTELNASRGVSPSEEFTGPAPAAPVASRDRCPRRDGRLLAARRGVVELWWAVPLCTFCALFISCGPTGIFFTTRATVGEELSRIGQRPQSGISFP